MSQGLKVALGRFWKPSSCRDDDKMGKGLFISVAFASRFRHMSNTATTTRVLSYPNLQLSSYPYLSLTFLAANITHLLTQKRPS